MVQSQTKDRYHTVVPDIDYFEKQIKCQYACPVNTPSGHYVTAISEGEFDKAAVLARGPNPFAQICGRVCAAPCQQACRRGSLDENIQIRMLKRSAMLYETENTKKQISSPLQISSPPALNCHPNILTSCLKLPPKYPHLPPKTATQVSSPLQISSPPA